ncbi:hypothetical protein GALL_554120 [mine drainage metagenome]|uniref:Uncharacterized protein n=1 Tax=mine drainage metagenome TaxID=410659 RepID=A0A1J5PHL7_9ZZZZ
MNVGARWLGRWLRLSKTQDHSEAERGFSTGGVASRQGTEVHPHRAYAVHKPLSERPIFTIENLGCTYGDHATLREAGGDQHEPCGP